MQRNKAIIISAPSGSGKTTLVKYLLQHIPNLKFSISATSRLKRENEVHGKDYYFMTPDEFKKNINLDGFVEWEEVYNGIYYGTLKSEVERIWAEGCSIIFDVDVKGGISLKNFFKDNGLAIFIKVKDISELERRLIRRNSDSQESITVRLAKVTEELRYEKDFDEIIVNDVLENSLKEAESIVNTFLT